MAIRLSSFLGLCLPLCSCFNLPVVSSGKVSVLDSAPRLAEGREVSTGKTVSAYDVNSKVATTIAAPSGALAGSAITIQPGSLGIAVDLVVEQAVSLSQTSLTSSLGISTSIALTPIGSGLIIRPSANVDLTKPLTIAMPLDPKAGLRLGLKFPQLALAGKSYAVFYKSFVGGELKAGVIPSSVLQFSEDGKVLFEGYFGAYWLVEVSEPIVTAVEIKTEEPIVNINNVSVVESSGIVTEESIVAKSAIPVVQWKGVSLVYNEKDRSVTLKGTLASTSSLRNCQVNIFESKDDSTGWNEATDSSLSYTYKIEKLKAHALVGRFRCLDDQGRLTVSDWSSSVSIPEAVIYGPNISEGVKSYQFDVGQTAPALNFNDLSTGTDIDRDGNAITYSCRYDQKIDGTMGSTAQTCANLAAFDSARGILASWLIRASDSGAELEFQIIATAASGLSSSTLFTIKVKSVQTVPSNTPPTITQIANQVLAFNTSSDPLSFTIGDAESTVDQLSVSVTSSNTALIAASNIFFSGTGAQRSVTLLPTANQSGTTLIKINISDASLVSSISFQVQVNSLSCLNNYLLIPGNSSLGTDPFCVMKYEAKYQTGFVSSSAAGPPWVYIGRGINSSEPGSAWKTCKDLGPNFDMITNAQWQTIARNIESIPANWRNGAIGNDAINIGNSDDAMALAASTLDTEGCINFIFNGAPAADCDGGWHINKRTHSLSTGAMIWDFAGNVSEWVQDDNGVSQGSDSYISQLTAGSYNLLQWGPLGDYTSLSSGDYGGLGFGYLSGSSGTIIRGGANLNSGVNTGIFASDLSKPVGSSDPTIGFRCVMNSQSPLMTLPNNLPAAQLDLDADTIRGAEGTPVSVWQNYNPPFSASYAYGIPTLAVSALNGHNAVRFTGGQSFQVSSIDSPISGSTSFTIAVVFQPSAIGSGSSGSQWYQNAGIVDSEQGGVTNDWGLSWNADRQLGAGIGSSDYTLNSASLTLGAPHIAFYTWDGGTGKIVLNVNGTATSYFSNAMVPRNSNQFLIGRANGSSFFSGLIAHLKIYSTVLTDEQINSLGNALSQRYGVSSTFMP